MKNSTFHHAVIASVLMSLAAALIALTGAPPPPVPPPRVVLPDKVGEYRGEDVVFCQNEHCLQSFPTSIVRQGNPCPECGGELAPVSLGEKQGLPPDTIIIHKEYRKGRRDEIFYVSVVISGAEQKSIHRPQQCLPAQGYVIQNSRRIDIPIGRPAPLRATLLDLRRLVRYPSGREESRFDAYLYWFTNGRYETPSYLECLYRMSLSRVGKRSAERWLYIAVATPRRDDSEEHLTRLTAFVAALHPSIAGSTMGQP
ncbi:MAG: EpsI family protein [Kiritimatiellae bacterium]|nr:EpsI family protein [Kiritimatiellia bacterium]